MYSDLFLFVNLVKKGTFTALAEIMDTSQATVSRRIKNLEENLGIQLIKRNSRGVVELTFQGQEIYNDLKGLEQQTADVVQNIINKNKKVDGILKVCLPKLFFERIISPNLDEFYERYPDAELVFSFNGGVIDIIKERCNVAISRFRPTSQASTISVLAKTKFKLYASKEYIKDYGKPNSLEELKMHNVAGAVDDGKICKELVAISEKHGESSVIEIEPKFVLDNAMCDVSMALNNQIIIKTLNVLVKGFEDKIEPVLDDYYFGDADFYLIRDSGIRSNLETAFINFVKEHVSSYLTERD